MKIEGGLRSVCEHGSIKGRADFQELQILVFVAGGAVLVGADETVLPLVGVPDRSEGPALFLILSPQFADLVLQVAIALQHAPQHHIAISILGRLSH